MAFVFAASVVHAAPDTPSDVVTKLLLDRGLIDSSLVNKATAVVTLSGPSIGQQVRDTTSNLVMSAMNLLGVRYQRGGTSAETGFDCSGFTRHIFESTLGLLLPRRADEQAKATGLVTVKRDELQPGDLVFFNTLKRTFSHVGIYVGNGKFIHAPHSGSEIRVESMGIAYWAKRFTGARRVTPAEGSSVATMAAATLIDSKSFMGPLPEPTPSTTGPTLPENALLN